MHSDISQWQNGGFIPTILDGRLQGYGRLSRLIMVYTFSNLTACCNVVFKSNVTLTKLCWEKY